MMITGRYAPSPTGDLHLGNLSTALLAWLHARLKGGRFLMRMEDLDTPRVVPGSADKILADLEWLGLDWDGEVVYQSQRQALYQQALEILSERNLIYPCFCSRKDIQLAASAPHAPTGVYPGTCSDLTAAAIAERTRAKSPAFRLRVESDLEADCGDFIVKRADQLFAYQLAVVVDDLEQKISHVVRGQDLIDSTGRQQYLARLLQPNIPSIEYHHVPLVCDSSGQRLAKRDGSTGVAHWRAEGKSAEDLVGDLSKQLGLMPTAEPLSANELLARIDIFALPMS